MGKFVLVVDVRHSRKVKLINTTNRSTFADFSPDGTLDTKRVVLLPRATRVIDLEGSRYTCVTVSPGVEVQAL